MTRSARKRTSGNVRPTNTQIIVQSDQSLCCSHEETLHTWVSKTRPMNILVTPRELQINLYLRLGYIIEGTFSDLAAYMIFVDVFYILLFQ